MLRNLSVVIAVAAALLPPVTASGAPLKAKRNVDRHWHGYGFLPGYPPAPRVDPYQGYWYGGPGFYRGRWNGGGFGPCWTKTPIGPINNC
jgi:hypothetical protein